MDAGEHVEQWAIGGSGEPHAVGGDTGTRKAPAVRSARRVGLLIPQGCRCDSTHTFRARKAHTLSSIPPTAVLSRVERRAAGSATRPAVRPSSSRAPSALSFPPHRRRRARWGPRG